MPISDHHAIDFVPNESSMTIIDTGSKCAPSERLEEPGV